MQRSIDIQNLKISATMLNVIHNKLTDAYPIILEIIQGAHQCTTHNFSMQRLIFSNTYLLKYLLYLDQFLLRIHSQNEYIDKL